MSELSVATVVCTATRERADLLRACVQSLVAGTRIPDELFVVVDQNPPLLAELEASLPAPVRLLHTERQGLSEARNVGLRAAASDVVAFVDDDATVDPDWLACLTRVFEADDRVLGAGGAALPRWGADRRWLPDELLWIVGCTYRGHREDAGPIRNPLGCNMAFRRRELVGAGAFAAGFGKRGTALETCDETELSLRIERGHGPGRIRYVPEARVRHFVPAERISWRLLLRRSVSEGLSKGRLHALYRGAALGPERAYTRRLLLDVVPRLLAGGVLRRDGRSARGGLAVLLSLAVTSVAFCVGALAARRTAARDKGRRRW